MEPHIPHTPRPRKHNLKLQITILAIIGTLLLAAGVGTVWLLSTGKPQAVPSTIQDVVMPEDSGVVACEAFRDSVEEAATTDDTAGVFTEDEYLAIRGMFADSEHETIRTNGTKLIDLGWQMEQMEDENGEVGVEALALFTPFLEAYSGLSGGCAEQGVIIPPLDFDEQS